MGFFSKPEVIGPGGDDDRKSRMIAEFEKRIDVDVEVEDRVDRLEQRVARLEAQLAQLTATPAGAVAAAAATVVQDDWMAEVHSLLRAGKKVHAVKVYRDHTGVGLKQAVAAVDALVV